MNKRNYFLVKDLPYVDIYYDKFCRVSLLPNGNVFVRKGTETQTFNFSKELDADAEEITDAEEIRKELERYFQPVVNVDKETSEKVVEKIEEIFDKQLDKNYKASSLEDESSQIESFIRVFTCSHLELDRLSSEIEEQYKNIRLEVLGECEPHDTKSDKYQVRLKRKISNKDFKEIEIRSGNITLITNDGVKKKYYDIDDNILEEFEENLNNSIPIGYLIKLHLLK